MSTTNFPTDVVIAGTLVVGAGFTPPAGSVGNASLAPQSVSGSKLTATLDTGYVPIPLSSARIISANDIPAASSNQGGTLAKDTAPVLERTNGATDPSLRIKWAASSVVEIQFAPVAYPPDLDATQPVTLKLRAKMAGSTDTPTVAAKYYEGIGGSNLGGNTAALSGAEQTLSVTIGVPSAPPQYANITLTPGSHGTDALYLMEAWLEYTRR